jgi:predicted GNAT family acetyltransferase
MHLLDNPIWSALTTTHSYLAEGDDRARRYPREITTLASVIAPSREAFDSLAKVAQPRETIAVLFDAVPRFNDQWELVRQLALVQMEQTSGDEELAHDASDVLPLGANDSPEMVELGTLTNPGPIGPRTYEIGDFIGIRDSDGQLIAMAGERMRVPGYSEISGVCTRPGFEGRGLAASLVIRLIDRIRNRDEVPFLHSRAENARAVKLYERLGFETTRTFQLGILRRV